MTRPRASERLRRLLALVPWVAAKDGARIDDITRRFGISRVELLAELEVVFLVGLHPFTPDELIDVVVDDDRVWIHYADFFSRPLRLTSEQALALVAAGSSLLSGPGAEHDGPLARGLAKVADALGIDPEEVDVSLGETGGPVLQVMRDAVADRRQVEIDYYAYGRDRRAVRVIEPHRVFADGGYWYVAGHCHRAGGDRVFRLDRIGEWSALDVMFDPPPSPSSLAVYTPSADDPRVQLELSPAARWVLEDHPAEATEELADGWCRVTLAVSARRWLERLLLRLGPDARLVDATGDLAGVPVTAEAARRVLARYEAAWAPTEPVRFRR